MAKHKVINIGQGPRFFHSTSGTKQLDPMKHEIVELDKAELKSLQGNKDFSVTEATGEESDLFDSAVRPIPEVKTEETGTEPPAAVVKDELYSKKSFKPKKFGE